MPEYPIMPSERHRTHHLAKMSPNEAEPFRVLLRKLAEVKGNYRLAGEFIGISESAVQNLAANNAVITAPMGAKILAAYRKWKESL